MLAVLYILFTARDLLISHKILFLISITTFLLATVHIVLALITDIQVTPSIHYTQAEVAIAQFEGLLGDSVIIWRVWVVWKRSLYVVALPIAATIAAFVVGILSAASLTSGTTLREVLPVPTGSLAIVNTALCTGLIAGRLVYLEWRMNQLMGSRSYTSVSYRKVILVVLESGAVLVTSNIIAMILEKLGNPGEHVVLNILSPLLGIAPTLIVVLAHLDIVIGNHANERYAESISISFAGRTIDRTFDTDHSASTKKAKVVTTISIVQDRRSDTGEYEMDYDNSRNGSLGAMHFSSRGEAESKVSMV